MNTEACDPAESAALRELFASRPEAAPAAGWEAVRSFEAEHGIVLPEPYRTFVAEICDGLGPVVRISVGEGAASGACACKAEEGGDAERR
ncbi:hypothetical protein ACFVTW_17575, partial [Streptomyces liangshanensis]